jgi:alkylated DNA repair dioxygenase AlkB
MERELSLQGSLLDLTGPAEPFDRRFGGIERVELSHDAWIDRQAGWVSRPDDLFLSLLETLDWQDGVERIRGAEVARPRQVANFSATSIPPSLSVINDMSATLSDRYRAELDRITCNLYRDGRDSVAWHGDRIARDLPEATVAIVSLGDDRPFRVRPKGGGSSIGWPAGRGDLIVMGGSCQRTYDHSVPKVAAAGPRIAVMFRHQYT